jgi:hypothetical protein
MSADAVATGIAKPNSLASTIAVSLRRMLNLPCGRRGERMPCSASVRVREPAQNLTQG